MAKKDFFIIVDTETTVKDNVVDFGAIVADRQGNILHSCGVLLGEYFGNEALFYRNDLGSTDIWSKQGKDRRFNNYKKMIQDGTRVLASVAAVNRWLERARGQYDPILTAYNLAFDLGKCKNSGIDLSIFSNSFCLWHAAAAKYAHTTKYKQFVLDNYEFNSPTAAGNMTYRTKAEVMTKFVLNQPEMEDEPHTALEDAQFYELPILLKLLKKTSKKRLLGIASGYSWRDYQVREHFQPK